VLYRDLTGFPDIGYAVTDIYIFLLKPKIWRIAKLFINFIYIFFQANCKNVKCGSVYGC